MPTEPVISGAIVPINIPDGACFTNFADLIRSLGEYLGVEIPNQDFSNVVISIQQPGTADIQKLWVQIGNSGTFIALRSYVPSLGVWAQLFPVPASVTWIAATPDYPDSDSPPPGWRLLEAGDTVATYATIMAQAEPPGLVGPYRFYPAIFIGF